MRQELLGKVSGWLHREIRKLIGEDSDNVLRNYILALLERDDSRDVCIEKLQEFLQEDTKRFVNNLFQFINDQSFSGGRSSSVVTGDSKKQLDIRKRKRSEERDSTSSSSSSSRAVGKHVVEKNPNRLKRSRHEEELPTEYR